LNINVYNYYPKKLLALRDEIEYKGLKIEILQKLVFVTMINLQRRGYLDSSSGTKVYSLIENTAKLT